MRVTVYDLRGTGITWMAIRGTEPLKIQSRAGHNNFQTTQGYIREVEALREGFGEVFPPLPSSLLGAAAAPTTLRSLNDTPELTDERRSPRKEVLARVLASPQVLANQPRKITANREQTLRRGRDSNPRYSCLYTTFPVLHLRPLGHLSWWQTAFPTKMRAWQAPTSLGKPKSQRAHPLRLHT